MNIGENIMRAPWSKTSAMNNVNTVQNPRTRRQDDRKVLGVTFSVSAPNAASWRGYLSSSPLAAG